jgi:hypothetical protein
MIRPLRFTAAALLAAAAAAPSALSAQSVSAVDGTLYNTSLVSNFQTTGFLMRGMSVNVCMSGGFGCRDYVWGNLSGSYSGVYDSGDFRIRVGDNEDTFNGDWRFDLYGNRDLRSVTFSGLSGNVMFDRTEPSPGTPGSADGLDGDVRNACFSVPGPNNDNCVDFGGATVEYRNKVALNGTFYDDLYESVHIDFTGSVLSGRDRNGGLDDDYSEFYLWMDTDNAAISIDPFVVPEPSSFALIGVGLFGLGAAARRRKNS